VRIRRSSVVAGMAGFLRGEEPAPAANKKAARNAGGWVGVCSGRLHVKRTPSSASGIGKLKYQ
jgi:hypothetical protein